MWPDLDFADLVMYVRQAYVSGGFKGRSRRHRRPGSYATALVKLKAHTKTVQGMPRYEDFGTTLQLYAQSDMESTREEQGMFLEQLLGDRIHLLTERVQ